ncbi:MAG: glycosyltransferase family 25 protein, partial [Proteobacteria bacterium]|nr:glycosyltransferase family 25 protein [Pseudomonadota bacterium]
EGRMRAVGLDRLIKVPAVEGAKLDLGAIQGMIRQPASRIEAAPPDHFTLTRPAVGCFLSHLALWQWMLDRRLPRLLVFEDDAFPAAAFDAGRFVETVGRVGGERGLVFGGCLIMDGLAERPTGELLSRLYFFNGTFAYLITPAVARGLMAEIVPLDGHIDHQISLALVRRRGDLAAWRAEPALFEPDWSLASDCFVALAEEEDANRALGRLFTETRALLLGEGRPLLPPYGAA